MTKYYGMIMLNFLAFSMLALMVGFVMLGFLISDYRHISSSSKIWLLGGLIFATVSAIGVFSLVFMKISGHVNRDCYLASTFFIFIFSTMAFLSWAVWDSYSIYCIKAELWFRRKTVEGFFGCFSYQLSCLMVCLLTG